MYGRPAAAPPAADAVPVCTCLLLLLLLLRSVMGVQLHARAVGDGARALVAVVVAAQHQVHLQGSGGVNGWVLMTALGKCAEGA